MHEWRCQYCKQFVPSGTVACADCAIDNRGPYKPSGTLRWAHASEIGTWPEMKEATPEEFPDIEIFRDEKGIITGARTKIADIVSLPSGLSGSPQNMQPFKPEVVCPYHGSTFVSICDGCVAANFKNMKNK